jgi:hypothetical protein
MPNTTIPKELRDEFMKIVQSGDEPKARKFLVDHFKEFPQATQDVITVAFLEEAVAKNNQGEELLADFRKKGLATLKALGQAGEELEKRAKLAEIKENIKK